MKPDAFVPTSADEKFVRMLKGRGAKDIAVYVGAAVLASGLSEKMIAFLEDHPDFDTRSFCEYARSILPDEFLIE